MHPPDHGRLPFGDVSSGSSAYALQQKTEISKSNFQPNSRVSGFLANCIFTDFPFWKKSPTLTPPAFDFLKTV